MVILKLLIEVDTKIIEDYQENIDGIILPLKDFSVQSHIYYSIDEIKEIKKNYPNLEIFIKIDKNIHNQELKPLEEVLIEIENLEIKGIFFYDLAVLELKRKLQLKTDLVWSSTFMVTNYHTCNYYNSLGVEYALASKEITKEEVLSMQKNTSINLIVEVVSKPSIAFSKRKLLTNYYKNLGKTKKNNLVIHEGVTDEDYQVVEEETGTGFFQDKILNLISFLKELDQASLSYVLMKEYQIPKFKELIKDTKKYLLEGCIDENYEKKWNEILGENTGFLEKKTVYRVKKDE